jgi:putative transposase
MLKTYKYRLYPTKSQSEAIDAMIETHRHLYNNALAERKNSWEEKQEIISGYDQSRAYTQERKVNEYYQQTNSASCGRTLRRLDHAFNDFFRRVKSGEKPGYPRFKGRNRFSSIEFKYGNGMKLKDKGLYVQHIGDIKIRLHRPVEGKIKTGIIKKQAEQYYVCFSVEFTPEFLEPTGHNVGLDMGISKLVITSDGQFFPQPKYLRQMEAKLRCAQRKVARRQNGSNRRRKAVLELQKLHQHVANQRRDMAQAGRQAVKVDPKYTSQICSGCGEIVKKGLSVRIHECPHCNLVLDRDVNAAINILQRALG